MSSYCGLIIIFLTLLLQGYRASPLAEPPEVLGSPTTTYQYNCRLSESHWRVNGKPLLLVYK